MDAISNYISQFEKETQKRLKELRIMVHDLAPNANESMAYGIPAYKLFGKPLIYFAGYKNHVGLYATPSGHAQFADKLMSYKQGKGSVQFANDRPLPLDLIREIIAFRVQENTQKFG